MEFSKTINLPKTNFSMKANLSVTENNWLKFWKEKKIYEQLKKNASNFKKYILHDGPPYANGDLHFQHGNNNKAIITGGSLKSGLDGSIDLGESGAKWQNVHAVRYYGDGSNLTGVVSGITTEAIVKTNGQTASLDLSKDDHKVTATGTVTIDVTGGSEADSHTLRIVNSGIATVGFSTYFIFPSGGTPSLPTTSGAISLISFTVHRAGAVGVSTQLLSGASVNFS